MSVNGGIDEEGSGAGGVVYEITSKSINLIAEAEGFTITSDVADALAEDVTYRLRETIFVSLIYGNSSRVR